jgi:hypothetical protein
MIAALPIPVPSVTTIARGRITVQPLRVVRTCDGCGTSSLDRSAAACPHSSCPIRGVLEHERLNDASDRACHHTKTTEIRARCFKTERPNGAND